MGDQGPGIPPQPPQSYPGQPPAQQPPGVPQQPGYGGPGMQAPRTNGLAVTSLILGLLWICWVGSILAVIFGHVAMGQIKKSNGTQTGNGLAIAGLILGYLGVVGLIIAILFGEWTFDFTTS